jgi:hypothetical protein
MSFLPDNYKEEVGNYHKFQSGDNNFRILSSAIVGNEYWKTTIGEDGKEVRKPIRKHLNETIPMSDIGVDKNGEPEKIKRFWAFVIWNRDYDKIQIMEITQGGIQKALYALTKSPKWGDIKGYDITVTKTGEKLNTEYSVMPNPKEDIDPGIVQLYKDMNINLDAMFSGDDPFVSDKTSKIADEVFEGLNK